MHGQAMEFPEPWRLRHSKSGVQVYMVQDSASQSWVKAQTVVNAPYWSLLNLLRDTQQADTWIDNIISVELLGQPDDYSDEVRSRFHSPWPFKDREMVTRSRVELSLPEKRLTITVTQVPTRSVNSDYVQMQNIAGVWTAVALNNEKTRIVWQGTGTPGGSIPNWIAKAAMARSTLRSFQGLRQQILVKKYHEKPLGYPKSP